MVRHTHSTVKLPEAEGGSERHLEEGTTDEREKNSRHQVCFSCRHIVITTVIYKHHSISIQDKNKYSSAVSWAQEVVNRKIQATMISTIFWNHNIKRAWSAIGHTVWNLVKFLYLIMDSHGIDTFQFACPVLCLIIWDVWYQNMHTQTYIHVNQCLELTSCPLWFQASYSRKLIIIH